MKDNSNSEFQENSFLYGTNAAFIEELYEKYIDNPDAVDPSWRDYFAKLDGITNKPSWSKNAPKVILGPEKTSNVLEKHPSPSCDDSSLRANFLINAYRERGHYLAKLDPLGLEKNANAEDLKLNYEEFGFMDSDLDKEISLQSVSSAIERCTLKELINLLQKTYSSNVGFEFNHVEDIAQKEWLYNYVENSNLSKPLIDSDQKNILKNLVEIEGFEQYLHKKFPGAKRFSIEGGENSIVALENIINKAVGVNIKEIVIGMAHRGRLNTLTKVMGKEYHALLAEFLGSSSLPSDVDAAGDVKYHMGFSNQKVIDNQKIHLSLTPNPSHLEAVNPVVAGKVRAKQDLAKDLNRNKVMGVLIHGDAAFCGQGIVAESLVMSGLKPFEIGGTIHLVINNQIGFTANSWDTRPGRYATEVAKMVGSPIIHVNGDDAEAVFLASIMALEFRCKFHKDIVLDIICYRKYGHNEGDEPMYTQGLMYKAIKDKKSPAEVYAQKLVNKGIISDAYLSNLKEKFKQFLNQEYQIAENYKAKVNWLEGNWQGFIRPETPGKDPITGVAKRELQELGNKLCHWPKNFAINSKIAKLLELRAENLNKDNPIDWATAELLAYASLLTEDVPIRLTGQDAGRGTFSHRHSVLHSQDSAEKYLPLNNLTPNQAKFEVADSNLSEFGVLGFEYGYSQVDPNSLVIWEAQFGDFANGAQIIFDQFISSAETKWLRMSGLVVLLPHGFEGQGPEHSSARLERFLQMAAEDNMQIVNPSTPASLFHLLRRQIKRNFRKPLIVMTPKSLLRHKLCVSSLSEIAENTNFIPVITDKSASKKKVTKLIFCSGKVYYDLLEAKEQAQLNYIAISRIEQYYPVPMEEIIQEILSYPNLKELVWCQEEPRNMGAWSFISEYLNQACQEAKKNSIKVSYIGRKNAASPAVGFQKLHLKEQQELINKALEMGA